MPFLSWRKSWSSKTKSVVLEKLSKLGCQNSLKKRVRKTLTLWLSWLAIMRHMKTRDWSVGHSDESEQSHRRLIRLRKSSMAWLTQSNSSTSAWWTSCCKKTISNSATSLTKTIQHSTSMMRSSPKTTCSISTTSTKSSKELKRSSSTKCWNLFRRCSGISSESLPMIAIPSSKINWSFTAYWRQKVT